MFIPFTLASLMAVSFTQDCSDGEIRLRGGSEVAGRVEICANETWGTICSRQWDYEDAQVVCNQLNLTHPDNLLGNGNGAAACGSACFGEGTGVVHYRDVNCPKPSEVQSLTECTLSTVGSGDCSKHDKDAGVICVFLPITTPTLLLTTTHELMETSEEKTEGTTSEDNNATGTGRHGSVELVGGALGALVGVLCMLSGCVITCWIVTTCKWQREILKLQGRKGTDNITDEVVNTFYVRTQATAS